ncbi:Rid family hydrolase [Streptomyces hydrogenans]
MRSKLGRTARRRRRSTGGGEEFPARRGEGDVVEQAEQCLRNIEAAPGQAECSFGDVVCVRYPLPAREDFEPCRPVLRRAFGGVRPAATMLVCGLADPRMKIEIEVSARRAPIRSPA